VPGTLHVPLVGQAGNNLCWAACMEMVTRYYHQRDSSTEVISQCKAVSDQLRALGDTAVCPTDSIPDVEGTPFAYEASVYTCANYSNGTKNGQNAIPIDTLAEEFANGRPVIFQWMWSGVVPATASKYGNHWLIAEGLPRSRYSKGAWVSVNDPMPPGEGHHRVMLYSEFSTALPVADQPGAKRMYDRRNVFCNHMCDYYHIAPLAQ
jgi:hypothetical protein